MLLLKDLLEWEIQQYISQHKQNEAYLYEFKHIR